MGKGVKRYTTGVCPWTSIILFINDYFSLVLWTRC